MTTLELRETAAMMTPAVIGFTYQWLASTEPTLDRLGAALGAGLVLYLFSLIAAGLAPLVADYLIGREAGPVPPPKTYHLGGALLVSVMWVWWQADRASTVRDIAVCVEQQARETAWSDFNGGSVVRWCYEQRPSWDNGDY